MVNTFVTLFCEERQTEIQYENRVLLRKMLKIDMTKKQKVEAAMRPPRPDMNPSALNQYNSLNRKVRIEDLSRIVNDNKQILSRLQSTKSHYRSENMTADFDRQQQLATRISNNANRYNKNPYFLHSICTPNEMPADNRSSGRNSRAQSAKPNHRRLRKSSRSKGTVSLHNLNNALPPVVNLRADQQQQEQMVVAPADQEVQV